MIENFKGKIQNLYAPICRRLVINEEILINKKCEIQFIHGGIKYKSTFLILPNPAAKKIIIGRKWIKEQWKRHSDGKRRYEYKFKPFQIGRLWKELIIYHIHFRLRLK